MRIWKKVLSVVLVVVMLAVSVPVMQVSAEEYGGTYRDSATWTYDIETKTLRIDGEGAVIEDALWVDEVRSIEIGENITELDLSIFEDCITLENIVVDENNKYYSSKDGVLYSKDLTSLLRFPIGSSKTAYEIPEGVTTIEEDAFFRCLTLESIKFPASVTEIEKFAFRNWVVIKEINVDSDNANFSSKDGVLFNKDMTELIKYPIDRTDEEYTVPDGVINITDFAFFSAINLEHVAFPNTLKTIGMSTFQLSSCEELLFPEGFEKIIEKDDEFLNYIVMLDLQSVTFPSTIKNQELVFMAPKMKNINNFSDSSVLVRTFFGFAGDLYYISEEKDAEQYSFYWQELTKLASCQLFGTEFGRFLDGYRYIEEEKLPENYWSDFEKFRSREIMSYLTDQGFSDGAIDMYFNVVLDSAGVCYIINSKLNKKFGTNYKEEETAKWLVQVFDDKEIVISKTPPEWLSVSCLDDSAQHEYCAENSINHNIMDADENTYTEGIVREPTCMKPGSKGLVCSCGFPLSEVEEIPTVDHSFTNYVTDVTDRSNIIAYCDYGCGATDIKKRVTASDPSCVSLVFQCLGCEISEVYEGKLEMITEDPCKGWFVLRDTSGFTAGCTIRLPEVKATSEDCYAVWYLAASMVPGIEIGSTFSGGSRFKIPEVAQGAEYMIFMAVEIPYSESCPLGDEHIFDDVKVTPPTYTQNGKKVFSCDCGYSYDEEIPKLELTPITNFKAENITSDSITLSWNSVSGADEYEIYEHKSLVNAETNEVEYYWENIAITADDSYVIDNLKHGTTYKFKMRAVVSDEDFYGSFTPTVMVTTNGCAHSFTSYTSNNDATCVKDGTETAECDYGCGATDTQIDENALKSHNYNGWSVLIEETCTQSGIKLRTCSDCGNNDIELIEETGHSFSEKFTIDIEATCTTEGSKSRHCTVCDAITDITVIEATGHSCDEDFTIDIEATCTTEGIKSRYCTVCDLKTDITVIEATGHSFCEDFMVDIEATCATKGSKSRHCTVCDAKTDETVIEMNSFHKYVDITNSPTCTSEGYVISICKYCEDTNKTVKEKLPHEDADENGLCDICSTILFEEDEPEEIDCACICHGTGINSFIYKLVRIFWKIFLINKTCDCGIAHY